MAITTLQSGLRPASHTTYVVCVNFMRERRDLKFKVDIERNFIYSQSFARNLLKRSRRRNIFLYFIFDDWPGIRTQAFGSNKPTHYVLDHGDFILEWRTVDGGNFKFQTRNSSHSSLVGLISSSPSSDISDKIKPWKTISKPDKSSESKIKHPS